MHITPTDNHLDFHTSERLVARYNFRDESKPCFHPLATPSGLVISAAAAHDHKHQKGLMYALRTSDINFWEERATTPLETTGRQRHESFLSLNDRGDTVGFSQSLTWEASDGTNPTFAEIRTVALSERNGDLHISWQNRITALRDTTLIMSQWARPNPSGQRVSYHGLALRMVRDFANTGGTQLIVDGAPLPMDQGLGRIPKEVTFIGTLDPVYPAWPPPRVAITFTQAQANAMGLRDAPFAFLSLGPSNLAPVPLRQGDELKESYTVTIADLP